MRSKIKNMDKSLFLLLILFTVLGLVMVYSASSMTAVLQYGQNGSYFFFRQLFFVIIAYIIGFFILFMPYGLIRQIKKMNKIIILAAIFLLIMTLVAGTRTNGATSWLKIGPISLQPAEFVKTMSILFIAFSFTNTKKMFSDYKFLTPFIWIIPIFLLIYKQPDLGTDMILVITCFIMFIGLPIKNKKFGKLKILAGACAIIVACMFFMGGNLLKNFLTEEQASRLTYNNPCTRYREKTGYQVCNGFIAINNGGLFGVGLGNSKQKYLYLPEAYTDFIFPIVVEELGSIPSSIILIFFLILLFVILKIARNSETLPGSLIAIGTFGLILAHLLVNLLGVLAIIPLTGVPLPFLSSGGSFAFNLIILIFMTLRVSIENKNIRLRREINNI